ncbi:MAG: flagellar hook-length control protein FliK [Gammaproteobacteria bacterium]|nr:flagellar hook-length control protein FliK [Gammaproteobacteria bacterium]
MINIPPIKPRTDIKSDILSDITKTWKVGQVLNATVEKGGKPLDTILLRLGQHLLESRTPITLKDGETIQLVVKQMGIEPLLGIKSQISTRETIVQLLRSFINNQQDIKPLIEISQKLLTTETLDTDIKIRLQQLVDSIARPQQAGDYRQLKTLIQNSGIFLEPRLLNSQSTELKQGSINQDIKNQLQVIRQLIEKELPVIKNASENKAPKLEQMVSQYLKGEISLKELAQFFTSRLPADKIQILINQLQASQNLTPVTKELLPLSIEQLLTHIQTQPNSKNLIDTLITLILKLPALSNLKNNVDSLLNKITSQQLLPLAKDADTPQFFLFDLPVKQNKETTVFQFRIDKEKNKSSDDEANWNVSINFEFEELGPIQAKIILSKKSISTLFHADRPVTANKIKAHLHLLESAFKIAGFTIDNISVLEKRIQQPRNIPRDIHFLDEKA